MIVLGADGVVRMTDIPDAWRDFDIDWDSGTGKLETFNGRWELHQAQDWWTVSVQRTDWGCDNCTRFWASRRPIDCSSTSVIRMPAWGMSFIR